MSDLRVDGNVIVIKSKKKKNYTDDSLKTVSNSIITPKNDVSAIDGKNNLNVIDIKASDEGRFELSWEEIGNSALHSAKKFVKGMFCDENGFSIKRTAMTVGIVAGLAFAAPAAAALGASTAVVGLIADTAYLAGLGLAGYMAYNGGKAAIENGQKYYDAKDEAEAKQSMNKAMDGAVELAAALPAFWAIKGGAGKGKNMSLNRDAAKKAKAETSAEPKPTEVKPTETVPEPKPVQEVKPAETNVALEPKPTDVKPAETSKPQVETKPDAKPTETQQSPKGETQTSEPRPTNPGEAVGKPERITGRNGMIIERSRNADGNIVKDVVTDANNKHLYTKKVFYTLDGQEVNYAIKWANGAVDIFFKGSSRGTRTMPDGSKYLIELKDNKIHIIDAVKPATPNAAQEKPPVQSETTEAKPIEVKPTQETKPTAETSKPEQPAKPKAGAPDDFTLQMQEVKSGLEKMMAAAEDPAKMKLVTDPRLKSALEGFNDHANVIKPLLKKIELHLNEGKNTFTDEDYSTLQYIIDILISLG